MSEQKYFYIENGTQTGPVSAEELLGKIGPNTDIWCPGMANWAPANTVPEVAALLGGASAPEPSMSDPAATPYTGGSGDYTSGNSQNYGNPDYANQQQPYGEPQQQPYGNPQQSYGNQQPYGNPQQPYGNQYPQKPYGNQQGAPAGNKPDNYLVWAILCTIFCCSLFSLPFGIASIVNASKVESAWNSGNYAEAQKASENAKKFAIICAIVGFICNLISFFISMGKY